MLAATAGPVALVATKSPVIVAVEFCSVVLPKVSSVASEEKVAAMLLEVSSDVNLILPNTLLNKLKLVAANILDPNVPTTKRVESVSDIAEFTSFD